MRPLTDNEMELVLDKIAKYIGENVAALASREDEPHVFRLHKDRVFYMTAKLASAAGAIGRSELMMAGCCLGRFTKSVRCVEPRRGWPSASAGPRPRRRR